MTLGVYSPRVVVESLLDLIVESALLRGVDLPDRHILPVGGAVFDCELVAVSFTELTPIDETACGPTQYNVSMMAVIARLSCANPGGRHGEDPPTPDGYLADLIAVGADTEILLEAANAAISACGSGSVNISVGEPSGGMVAAVATVTLPLWFSKEEIV